MKRWIIGIAAWLCLPSAGFAALAPEEPVLLPPEEAFAMSAEVREGVVVLHWSVAEGYYLYRKRFGFESGTAGVSLGQASIPPGKLKHDEFFGDMAVLRNRFSIELPYGHSGLRPAVLELRATSQGCADLGVCYPPYTRTLSLDLPVESGAEKRGQSQFTKIDSDPFFQSNALEALAQFAGTLGGSSAEQFLDPDVAYVLSVRRVGDGTVAAWWDIADGYYLYRDKFKVSVDASSGFEVVSSTLPVGIPKHDEYFGDVDVFYGQVENLIVLRRVGETSDTVELELGYQGCAEAGLCYPPITKTVSLTFPTGAERGEKRGQSQFTKIDSDPFSPLFAPLSPATTLSAQDRIARSLVLGNLGLTLLKFFGFGLLLTFTPCVLPMIPILSSIIVGQGQSITPRKAFALSLVYVLAMATVYTAAGVAAGLLGSSLQAAFQNPWVLTGFGAVFVLLAASMFGLFELQVPASWQSKLAAVTHNHIGGTYAGVAVMGLLSALIVGPCVAAPLAGALIYIGETGDAVLGGAALFAMSMGMGAPLLLVGTSAGRLLPNAGPWMSKVKALFGFILLGVAIYLMERVLPASIVMVLWASLLIGAACYMGVLKSLKRGTGTLQRLSKAGGYAVLVYGLLLIVGAARGGDDPLRPLQAFTGEPRHLEFKTVKDLQTLEAELHRAVEQGRPVMLDYYADWCVSCKELEKHTFTSPEVQAVLADTMLLQADVTAYDADDRELLERFGLIGPPAILFFGSDGRERPQFRLVGFVKAEDFSAHARRAQG